MGASVTSELDAQALLCSTLIERTEGMREAGWSLAVHSLGVIA